MNHLFSDLNEETKINLALSYQNADIIEKFCSEYDLEEELAKEYFVEIKKFLYLCANTTDRLAPSAEIDKIWHTFILFTKDYRHYCMDFLGKFIDHIPEVKKGNSEPKENCLLNTISHYEKIFGEINNEVWQIPLSNTVTEEDDDDCSDCNNCSNDDDSYDSRCSACDSGGSQPSCVYTGNCFHCTNSGHSCIGENPNNL